jgi:hypothetical protein
VEKVCEQLAIKTVILNFDFEGIVMGNCWPLLQFAFVPCPSEVYLKIFLAVFGDYGQSRATWEHLAGIRKDLLSQKALTQEEKSLTEDDMMISMDFVFAYAWAIQILLGYKGMHTLATRFATVVSLQSKEVSIHIAINFIVVMEERYFFYSLVMIKY